jgi:hypothetical protein
MLETFRSLAAVGKGVIIHLLSHSESTCFFVIGAVASFGL